MGILNASVWFGASLFFALGVLPAVFSQELRNLFQASGFAYYSGGVALALFHRFFVLHYICGVIALLHLGLEKIYIGRDFNKYAAGLAGGILAFALLGGFWLQPHMERMRHEMYFNPKPELRERARHSFGLWHGASQGVNMIMLLGLLAHLVRNARPAAAENSRTYYNIPS